MVVCGCECSCSMQDMLGGYQCDCAMGWNGDRCHVDIDDCVSSPCQNGGSCFVSVSLIDSHTHTNTHTCTTSQDLVNGYTCVCVRGWEGQNCHMEVNECDPNPCQNGADCSVS